MTLITPEIAGEVNHAIRRDRENLFELTDEVLAAAPSRDWQAWVVDGCSAYYLAEYLRHIGTNTNHDVLNWDVPVVHIANSRSVKNSPEHIAAVRERLAQPDLNIMGNDVLVLSEYARYGGAIGSLCEPLHDLRARSVGAAILSNDDPTMRAYSGYLRAPDEVYGGGPIPRQPYMYNSEIITRAAGLTCILGCAEAQDSPDFDPGLRTYVSEAYADLARNYIKQRM